MIINSKKANEIDAYISSKPSCSKGKASVEIKGKLDYRDAYMIPLSYLQYNHENRRFNLEIRDYENQIKRTLDPTDKEDANKIKEFLLQDKVEAEKLFNDLKQLGEQREVAAITHDGVVINGNRRMATIEKLHEENPKMWDELWVVRLPEDISEKDLWKIEAGLQLSKEKVANYGPVNNLLMIREGKKAGLSHAEIAASMYGWSDKQVTSDLERLDLIDIFLQFFGGPNNYGLIKKYRLHEHFEDIQQRFIDKQKKLSLSKKELRSKLEIIFLYLRATIKNPTFKFTHTNTREMCKILHDADATFALSDSFDKYKDLRKIPIEKLADNLDKANDVRKNKEDKAKPGKLIERAISALNGIDRKGNPFKTDEVKKKLKELHLIVKEMKSQLGIKG